MSNWRRPILFEDVALPDTAIAIDHLGAYQNLPEMSEATSVWLWRFTICIGVPCEDDSSAILLHVEETLHLIARFRQRLLLTVEARFDGPFGADVLDSWILALQMIKEIAARRSRCMWIAPLRPGDQQYGRPPQEILGDISRNLEKAIDQASGT